MQMLKCQRQKEIVGQGPRIIEDAGDPKSRPTERVPEAKQFLASAPQGAAFLEPCRLLCSGYAPASLGVPAVGCALERSLALWLLAGHLAQFCSHLLSCSLAADQTTLS